MKLAIDIVITFFVLFWPILVMFSPMAFDAPGSEYCRSNLLSVVGICYYPSVIFLIYMLLGAKFYGWSSTVMFSLSLAVETAAFVFLGYPKFIRDGWRGASR